MKRISNILHPLTLPWLLFLLAGVGILFQVVEGSLLRDMNRKMRLTLNAQAEKALGILQTVGEQQGRLPEGETCRSALKAALEISQGPATGEDPGSKPEQIWTHLSVYTLQGPQACSWPPVSAGTAPQHLPEIARALEGTVSEATHETPESGDRLMVTAMPLRLEGRIVAAIKATMPMPEGPYWPPGLSEALAAAAVALVSATLISGYWARRRELRLWGELERLLESISQEQAPTAGDPAQRLEQTIRGYRKRESGLARRLDEHQAVLSSMTEGVLAVSASMRVLNINQAAARMFEVPADGARGRDLIEVIRNPAMRRFITETLANDEPLERELELGGIFIQAHGTRLRDEKNRALGALLVLNDVTGLRRLENVRREFVANVSHELKTPITSIRGFAETLLGGAVNDQEKARSFLEIILNQSVRLEEIIEDLLSLSRIETEAERGLVSTAPANLAQVLQAAVELCSAKARERSVSILVDCPDPMEIILNRPLMEQALLNLIDNAIKYGPEKGEVRISVSGDGNEVAVTVADQGPGIPSEHHERLFERFYRVEKSRDRSRGGTGLGLSIVKHIAAAHGGRISVDSKPGKGSRFTLRLPVR
ncbi:MAG: ATP-binding protein [Deltaproteobacteria bacterium]|nr:ATP-binding protein [Deltaproteobacteria bacterium]